MSFGEPANPDADPRATGARRKGLTGGERRQQDMLCVNPITGTHDGAARCRRQSRHAGPDGGPRSRRRSQPELVGAHCDKGLLILDGAIPPLGPFVLPGNNYHVYDYALFWGAIRRDAERRLAAWQR